MASGIDSALSGSGATPPGEFQGRALLILGAAVALSTGMTATLFYSLGSLIPALEAEFGWNRAGISLALGAMTIGLFIAGPIVGRLCDRYGAARVASLSLISYALAIIVMALSLRSLTMLLVFYFVIAMLGAGSTPIGVVRAITANFDKHRGLALGIVLTGAGLAGFWVPNLVARLIDFSGWRMAYFGLASVALLATPLVWMGLRSVEGRSPGTAASPVATAGLSSREARRKAPYWLLSIMALAMALGIAGVVVHLPPLFTDLGQNPVAAAGTASLLGLSSVVGRIVVGLMLDRFRPSLVSMAVLVLATLGIVLLYAFGLQFAPLAVILLGLAAGAEIDLLAYLTARLFGQRNYGAIYGWQYSVFALGYGFSPVLVGRLRDLSGSYDLALMASAALMAVAAVAALILPSKALFGNDA